VLQAEAGHAGVLGFFAYKELLTTFKLANTNTCSP